jgi:hypothetical protein
MHVFDHTIKPILLYGSDIWGMFNPFTMKCKKISLPALLKIRILVLLVLTVKHQSLQYVLSTCISRFSCKPLADLDSNIISSTKSVIFFPLNVGVKQGDNLSPSLFKIFVNDLPSYHS